MIQLSTVLEGGGALVPQSVSTGVFITPSVVLHIFQFFLVANLLPACSPYYQYYTYICFQKISSMWNFSKRPFDVCFLWWFILQDGSDFGSVLGAWQMLSGFWMCSNLTFKRVISSIITSITCMSTEPCISFFPDAQMYIVPLSVLQRKDEKQESNSQA